MITSNSSSEFQSHKEIAMKNKQEVGTFKYEASIRAMKCPECKGALNQLCACTARFRFEVEAFESCIPRDFWDIEEKDISHNVEAFKDFIKPYCKKLNKAHKHGYGLLLSGPNGVGKTTFMSYVLTCAIRRGKSVYYTTMLQLDHDIKAGFGDVQSQIRLEWMLTSDFLGLDEMGKEQFKGIDRPTFIKAQIERILKQRFDESRPVILATNLNASSLAKSYGDSIVSIVQGKYQQVVMEPGDFRKTIGEKMAKDMGYLS